MKKKQLMEYDWMVEYTPQKEWIEGQGVFLWLAFFFSELGAGIYLVSIMVDFRMGWLVGWLVSIVLGGLIHLGFLGHPMRSWRILRKPLTSELSRGFWILSLFVIIGLFQVAPTVFYGLPWAGDGIIIKTIMGTLCVLIIIHGFMTMNVVRALPLWNSSLIIPLSLASGIWIGSQATELMLHATGHNIYIIEIWSRWSLLSYMALVLLYLWGTYHSSDNARESIKKMLAGDSAVQFYVWVLTVGLILPLAITVYIWLSDVRDVSGILLIGRFVFVLIGDLMMRRIIMEEAIYNPIL
jgi:DMSO reductase anchor subunit